MSEKNEYDRHPETEQSLLEDRVTASAACSPTPFYSAKPNPASLSPRRVKLICTLLYTATLLYGIDSTVVATLATPIATSFSQLHRAAWVNSAYLLSVACCTPLYGRLSDILGRRVVVLFGLSLFISGSLLCGLSTSMNMLVFARLIQGAGGGGCGMLGSIIISDVVSLRTRGLLSGIGSVCWATGTSLGGVYGGVIADTLGWRWAFLLQVPALTIIMVGLAFTVDYAVPGQRASWSAVAQRLDWAGAALLIIAIGSLVISVALKTNEDLPWTHPVVFGTLILAVLAFAAFVLAELYWAPEPVVQLGLLKDWSRVAMLSSVWSMSAATISLGLFFPMFLQLVRDNSPSFAGLHLIPITIAGALGGVITGFYIRATGNYYILLLGLGILQFVPCFLLARFTANTREYLTWIILAPQRLGGSGFDDVLIVALLATVSRLEIAQATSLRFLFRSSGEVLGMALTSAIQQSVLAGELAQTIVGDDAPAVIAQIRHNATALADLPPPAYSAAIDAYTTSLHAVFIANGTLALAALLFMCCTREYSLDEKPAETNEEYKLLAKDEEAEVAA